MTSDSNYAVRGFYLYGMSDICSCYEGVSVGSLVIIQDPNDLYTPVVGVVAEITVGMDQYYLRVKDSDIWYPWSSVCEVDIYERF